MQLFICYIVCSILAFTCHAYPSAQPNLNLDVSDDVVYQTDLNLERRDSNPLQYTEGPRRISLHVTVLIDPVNITRFLQALKPAFDAVTNEKLNTFFEVFQSPDTPGEFRWVENWSETIDYFNNVQLQKPYYVPYLAVTEPMWLKPRVIENFEKLDTVDWLRAKL